MVYDYIIDGIEVRTGDIICTTDGGRTLGSGQFWWLVGKLIPGEVDHIAVYLGPGGRCIEAGPKGIRTFEVPGGRWDTDAMKGERIIEDSLHSIGSPRDLLGLSPEIQLDVRGRVAEYCLAQEGKPYNINFLNSATEESFYCSHLAYRAYLPHGINLNTNAGIPDIPFTESIIFPQEVWEGCATSKP